MTGGGTEGGAILLAVLQTLFSCSKMSLFYLKTCTPMKGTPGEPPEAPLEEVLSPGRGLKELHKLVGSYQKHYAHEITKLDFYRGLQLHFRGLRSHCSYSFLFF